MDTNLANPRNEPANTSSLRSFWGWVVKVPPTPDLREQPARLVAALSALMSIVLLAEVARFLLSSRSLASNALLILSMGIVLAVYLLNRQGRFKSAAIGLTGVVAIAPFFVVFAGEKDLALLGLVMIMSATSVPLILIFFTRPKWALTTALILAILYLTVPFLNPVYSVVEVIYFLVGLATLGLVGALFENYRLGVEEQRFTSLQAANTTLKASEETLLKANAKLIQEAKDNAIELQAALDEFGRAHEETEQAKQEAERANLVKSAFLASMSHELRTPLNAVINFTKFVAKGSLGPVNTEQADTLYEVIDSAKHLLSLINDVLDMSKIESGTLNLFIEQDINLKELLDSAISMGKSLLADKPVELQADIAPDLPTISGDRQRILQVLLNVVSNACKFTEQGHIKIRAYRLDDEIRFAVEDNGPGIAPEDHGAVFQAFKQTETGLRQGGGTGLGMPISKNLVEAHGGRLWLESQVGKGSTFYVALPIDSAKSTLRTDGSRAA